MRWANLVIKLEIAHDRGMTYRAISRAIIRGAHEDRYVWLPPNRAEAARWGRVLCQLVIRGRVRRRPWSSPTSSPTSWMELLTGAAANRTIGVVLAR